jgi:hypothetical protein
VAHTAAQGGDIKALQQEVAKKKDVVRAKDANGWTVCFFFMSLVLKVAIC